MAYGTQIPLSSARARGSSTSGSCPSGCDGQACIATGAKWTAVGKEKWDQHVPGAPVQFEPFIDYVLNESAIAACKYVFPFLPGRSMFTGHEPAHYEEFRHTWILVRRQRPVVPLPEQFPLPSKRMSKNLRATINLVYLHRWTESTRMATAAVPHLTD